MYARWAATCSGLIVDGRFFCLTVARRDSNDRFNEVHKSRKKDDEKDVTITGSGSGIPT